MAKVTITITDVDEAIILDAQLEDLPDDGVSSAAICSIGIHALFDTGLLTEAGILVMSATANGINVDEAIRKRYNGPFLQGIAEESSIDK